MSNQSQRRLRPIKGNYMLSHLVSSAPKGAKCNSPAQRAGSQPTPDE